MAVRSESLLRYIRRLVIRAEPNEASDALLLHRFIADRDERAFTALVNRHAALVLRVCWRVLGDTDAAQEAFQATFLVLARKAATVQPPAALAAWLHGVAQRVALKTRAARLRQFRAEAPLPTSVLDHRPDPLAELSSREMLAIVDEEVRRLAEVYRLPVILCCLEGLSQEEAARQLGWTVGSVKGRLERGRARLHERLRRRGLMLSAALAAVEVSRGAASAVALAPLTDFTIQGAMAFAARQTPATSGVTELAAVVARDVSRSMGLAKLKIVAALILTTSLLTAGWLGYLSPRTVPDAPSAPSPSANGEGLAARVKADPNEEGRLRASLDTPIEVRGCVLDPQGKPFAGARLYVGYAPRRYEPDAIAHEPVYPLRATSGTDGRFRFAFTRSELDERYLDASRPVVIAAADGFGLDWSEIGVRAAETFLNLHLVEDRPVEGRLLDTNGKPVAGAAVVVREVSSETAAGLARFVERFDRGFEPFKSCLGPLPGQPRATTAADGRFRLSGVGRDRLVTLALEGSAIPATTCQVATRPAAEVASKLIRGVPFEVTLAVSRSIQGVVRDKATGAPLAGVKMSAARISSTVISTTYTDKDGRYELCGLSGPQGHVVVAQPRSEQPFFTAEKRLPDSADPLRADFALSRGIPLRGRVVVETTAKPPKRGLLEYYPLFPNPHIASLTERNRLLAASSAALQADGSYHLTVLPGPGVVLVRASPRDSYASALLDDKELANLFHDGLDHGGGSWIQIAAGAGRASRRCVDRYNALSLIEPDERVKSLTLDFTVQPALPLRGTVVGPEGEACAGVRVNGLTSMPDAETLGSASFLVEGLNPQRPRTLSFYDREKGLGKVVTLRGDEASPLTVQLEPCGVVMGRMVDKDGNPVSGVEILFGREDKGLDARAETDRGGHFRAALVPGLRYRFGLLTARRLLKRVDPVEVGSGRTKDLGDVPLSD